MPGSYNQDKVLQKSSYNMKPINTLLYMSCDKCKLTDNNVFQDVLTPIL